MNMGMSSVWGQVFQEMCKNISHCGKKWGTQHAQESSATGAVHLTAVPQVIILAFYFPSIQILCTKLFYKGVYVAKGTSDF